MPEPSANQAFLEPSQCCRCAFGSARSRVRVSADRWCCEFIFPQSYRSRRHAHYRILSCCNRTVVLVVAACGLAAADSAYLFAYFIGKGADGLHLAWSEDGYRWQALGGGASFLTPQVGKDRLMRDPSVVAGPDGTYHLVWTTGWWDRSIGHASTRDFLVWSEQQAVPVMEHEPTTRNAWAPEVTWDERRRRFLVYWASTIRAHFPRRRPPPRAISTTASTPRRRAIGNRSSRRASSASPGSA
jgi:hypothetical protein